jgi:hypothetical protein
MIKIHETATLPVHLYGCETQCDPDVRAGTKRVLRRMFGTNKARAEISHSLPSQNIE